MVCCGGGLIINEKGGKIYCGDCGSEMSIEYIQLKTNPNQAWRVVRCPQHGAYKKGIAPFPNEGVL